MSSIDQLRREAGVNREIWVASSVYEDVVRHCQSDTSQEVGGFLLGDGQGSTTRVRKAIPANHTESGAAHLTFTQESWAEAFEALPTVDRDARIVGWYHSHPGHGVFLSGYDQFIQKNFFGADDQVALVMDPQTGATQWFVNQDEDVAPHGEALKFEAKAPSSETRKPSAQRSGRMNLVLPVAALVGIAGVAGYLLADLTTDETTPTVSSAQPTSGPGNTQPLTDRLAALENRIANL
jgi:proteasome lid subunit RPN8/RPN11